MTQADMLELLKTMLGDTDDADATLLSYLSDAKDVLLCRLYPYMNDSDYDAASVPRKFERKQVEIAAYLLNKRGAEGEIQHIENGIHRNYRNAGVPYEMLQDVYPMVGIPR